MYIVYKIISKIDSRYYIGVHKTNNIDDNYMGSGLIINRLVKKYKRNNFKKITIIEFNNAEEAFKKEKEILSQCLGDKKCVNIAEGGHGGANFKGKCHSEKTKKKISSTLKGRNLSPEHKVKLLNNYWLKRNPETQKKYAQKGGMKACSDNTKKKLSDSLLRYYKTPKGILSKKRQSDYLKKINKNKKDKKLTKEHRNKISKSMIGHIVKKETKEKISKAFKGKRLSEEHKKKISDNHAKHWLGKKFSEETKQRMSKK